MEKVPNRLIANEGVKLDYLYILNLSSPSLKLLTRTCSLYRSSFISDTRYDVSVALPKGDKYFGHVTINFDINDIKKADKPLFVDYLGTQIRNFVVNGQKVAKLDKTEYKKQSRIPVDIVMLKQGKNSISIDFLNDYRKDGIGLHSFTDKVDKL